ncbi:MAG: MFS transporter [Luteitalea sp.]|nr:MFS transporter [Luteitalea sp.]
MSRTTEAPSRLPRYMVIAALFVLSLITYIDRAAISTAKGPMAGDLSLSDAQMGFVFSAFALGYAAAQIPSGWFADRIGPRHALAIVVALWSVLTALTGAMTRLGSLLVVRFLFGVAEAGAFPGSARVFYNWLPAAERGIANGVLFSGGLLGAAVAFPIFVWLLEGYGWRRAFYILGIPGLVWVLCWLIWFRDYPRERIVHESTASGPERGLGELLRSRGMILAMVQYFAGNFTFYICISWMHPFLLEQYSLTQNQAARYAMVPLLCGASANWAAGLFVDFLYKSRFRAWSRRLPGMAGFVLATTGVLWASVADSAVGAVVGLAVATFGVEMTISPSWAFCLDVGGKRSGAVSASMNMAGNFGGFVSTNAFPLLRRLTGSPATYFQVAALLNFAAILCWRSMRSPAAVETGDAEARLSEQERGYHKPRA